MWSCDSHVTVYNSIFHAFRQHRTSHCSYRRSADVEIELEMDHYDFGSTWFAIIAQMNHFRFVILNYDEVLVFMNQKGVPGRKMFNQLYRRHASNHIKCSRDLRESKRANVSLDSVSYCTFIVFTLFIPFLCMFIFYDAALYILCLEPHIFVHPSLGCRVYNFSFSPFYQPKENLSPFYILRKMKNIISSFVCCTPACFYQHTNNFLLFPIINGKWDKDFFFSLSLSVCIYLSAL